MRIKQQGAVSLFVVIFTALLITTITVSFVQLMVRDQQQAMYSDLSESAYDSATAGVEDAKRALLMLQDCASQTSQRCSQLGAAIDSGQCTTLSSVFGGSSSGEVTVAQNATDRKLEQAYTCVKITRDTPDYLGTLEPNANGHIIPLRTKKSFNRIVISWALAKSGVKIELPTLDMIDEGKLPVRSSTGSTVWKSTYPALMRAQLINGGADFRLSDFDSSGFSNTLFFYPSRTTGTKDFALDGRRSGAGTARPQQVECTDKPASGAYACSTTIILSEEVPAYSKTAFLNIGAFYNATEFRVQLKDGDLPSDIAVFDNVQPEVDSTGRANDLFRRVVSRVELNNAINYPTAALETKNSICKIFSVTNDPADYNPPACDPKK